MLHIYVYKHTYIAIAMFCLHIYLHTYVIVQNTFAPELPRCRSQKVKVRNRMFIKQGSRYLTPGMFIKPLKASHKWKLMPCKVDRNS